MASNDLTLVPFEIAPGLKRQSTQTAAKGAWYDSDKVRFRDGRPESMRGWQVRTGAYLGTARDLVTWQDLNNQPLAAWGTECKLYLYEGGASYDITPVATSTSVNITTSAGSPFYLVSGANGGILAGDYTILSSVNVGQTVISGQYQAVSVIGLNAFVVSAPTAAVSSGVSASRADILLNCGASSSYFTAGYGAGTYGTGAYGVGGGGSFFVEARTWSLDTWGEDLLANPRGGKLYLWDASEPVGSRAYAVTAAPSVVDFTVVSQQDRHAFALGTTDVLTGVYNPLLVRWCSQEDLNDWAVSATNTAGFKELRPGTRLMGGVNTKNGLLIWSDNAAHLAQYIGPPFTFGFQELGTGLGLIAPNAGVDLNGVVYWMSRDNFFRFDGQVRPLPPDIRKDVFDDFNRTQAIKVYAGTNREFDEVIWLYPSANSQEIDRYALFNARENVWAWGNFTWTAWADRGVFPNILTASGADARIYDHELQGYYEANGAPMNSWVESGFFDIEGGGQMMYTDKLVPDTEFDGPGGYIDIYLQLRKYPNGQAMLRGPYRVLADTKFVSPRGRGRQAAITVAASTGTARWRLGAMRVALGKDGYQ